MWLLEAILVGLVVGAIARLLVPGRHPRGLIVTVIVGIAGSVIATGGRERRPASTTPASRPASSARSSAP